MEKIVDLIEFASLYAPVEIRITEKPSNYVAEHEPVYKSNGAIKKHVIWIYLPELVTDSRDFHTVIAHELIHAMQAEKEIDEWHGKFFAVKAKEFKENFDYLGDVFDPEIDE